VFVKLLPLSLGVSTTFPVDAEAVYTALYVPSLLSVTVPTDPADGVAKLMTAPAEALIFAPDAFRSCTVTVVVPLVGMMGGSATTVEVVRSAWAKTEKTGRHVNQIPTIIRPDITALKKRPIGLHQESQPRKP
jgi:hypothetical protein